MTEEVKWTRYAWVTERPELGPWHEGPGHRVHPTKGRYTLCGIDLMGGILTEWPGPLVTKTARSYPSDDELLTCMACRAIVGCTS